MSSDTTKLVLNTDARTVNTKTPIRLGSPRTTRQDDRISVCRRTWVARLYYIWMQKDMGSQTLLSQYAATLIISGCRRTWAARLYYLSMEPLLLSQYAEGHGQPDSIISVCRRTWAARLYYLSMQPLLLSQYAEGLGQPNSTELHRNQYLCMRKGTIWCWRDFHRAVFCNTPPSPHPQHPPPIWCTLHSPPQTSVI